MAATTISGKFPVSDNVAQMKASSTLAAMQAAEAMRAAGVDVVDLGAGEPDFDTPQNIKDAAAAAMRAGKTKYTPTAGTRELQQPIIAVFYRQFPAGQIRNNQRKASACGTCMPSRRNVFFVLYPRLRKYLAQQFCVRKCDAVCASPDRFRKPTP